MLENWKKSLGASNCGRLLHKQRVNWSSCEKWFALLVLIQSLTVKFFIDIQNSMLNECESQDLLQTEASTGRRWQNT